MYHSPRSATPPRAFRLSLSQKARSASSVRAGAPPPSDRSLHRKLRLRLVRCSQSCRASRSRSRRRSGLAIRPAHSSSPRQLAHSHSSRLRLLLRLRKRGRRDQDPTFRSHLSLLLHRRLRPHLLLLGLPPLILPLPHPRLRRAANLAQAPAPTPHSTRNTPHINLPPPLRRSRPPQRPPHAHSRPSPFLSPRARPTRAARVPVVEAMGRGTLPIPGL